ncbi:MAG: hypothetical protein HY578_02190 [Nitrospinae bacterium]|nr:hypothetical protein [Nitrospinota bacterium]
MIDKETIDLECPCCKAKLTIDVHMGKIIKFVESPQEKVIADLKEGIELLKEKSTEREEKFKKSLEEQKHKGEILKRQFDELLKKKGEDTGEKHIRDIDLD